MLVAQSRTVYDAKLSKIGEKHLTDDYYKFMNEILAYLMQRQNEKKQSKNQLTFPILFKHIKINSYLNKKLGKAELKAE